MSLTNPGVGGPKSGEFPDLSFIQSDSDSIGFSLPDDKDLSLVNMKDDGTIRGTDLETGKEFMYIYDIDTYLKQDRKDLTQLPEVEVLEILGRLLKQTENTHLMAVELFENEALWDDFLNNERRRVRERYGFSEEISYDKDFALEMKKKYQDAGVKILPKDNFKDEKSGRANAAVEKDLNSQTWILYFKNGEKDVKDILNSPDLENDLVTLQHEWIHINQPYMGELDFDILLNEYEAYLATGVDADPITFISRMLLSINNDEYKLSPQSELEQIAGVDNPRENLIAYDFVRKFVDPFSGKLKIHQRDILTLIEKSEMPPEAKKWAEKITWAINEPSAVSMEEKANLEVSQAEGVNGALQKLDFYPSLSETLVERRERLKNMKRLNVQDLRVEGLFGPNSTRGKGRYAPEYDVAVMKAREQEYIDTGGLQEELEAYRKRYPGKDIVRGEHGWLVLDRPHVR